MDELASEAARQPEALQEYMRTKVPRAPAGSIFVGAGDSYAAALAGFYASGGRCIAVDPYSLASDPGIARAAHVFIISVSGRTSSNLRAATRVKGIARKTTVLTAAQESPLADAADGAVVLPMAYAPRTPGILSFTLSALAILKMVGAAGQCDFRRAYDSAGSHASGMRLARGTTYLLGNGMAHAAAVYGSAKVYELLGARCHAEILEEFSHMELFSLRKPDAVNAFADFDPDGLADRLVGALSAEGWASAAVPAHGRTLTESFFHCIFVGQRWCLSEAARAGVKRPRFLAGPKRLRASDSMIY